MKNSDFESLQRGIAEAKAYLKGERKGYVVHEALDVRQVRERIGLTRRAFAERYRLDVRAVEQWEQGRRRPERGTEMYLRLIESDPETVAGMVAGLDEALSSPVRLGGDREEAGGLAARVAEDQVAYQAEEQAANQLSPAKKRSRSRRKWTTPGVKQLKAGEAEFGLRDRQPALLWS